MAGFSNISTKNASSSSAKIDNASVIDQIGDYVKFLMHQVKLCRPIPQEIKLVNETEKMISLEEWNEHGFIDSQPTRINPHSNIVIPRNKYLANTANSHSSRSIKVVIGSVCKSILSSSAFGMNREMVFQQAEDGQLHISFG